jgi:hypothetical protein
MYKKNVVELFGDTLALAGVKSIYGVAATPSTASRMPSAGERISDGCPSDTKRPRPVPPAPRRT